MTQEYNLKIALAPHGQLLECFQYTIHIPAGNDGMELGQFLLSVHSLQAIPVHKQVRYESGEIFQRLVPRLVLLTKKT